HAVAHENDLISIELMQKPVSGQFLLDPMRLDCCTHSMITLFPELRAEERGVTYIPVRLDEYALLQPGGVPVRSVMEVLDKTDRSIFVNFYVFDADDALIATLRGVRCQALAVKRPRSIETLALVEVPALIDGVVAGETGAPCKAS